MKRAMTSKERFHATIERRQVDRPAWWMGAPVTAAVKPLCDYFKARDLHDLQMKVGDDVWTVEVPYDNPPSNHVACAFNFAKAREYHERTLTAPGFFDGVRDPARVGDFRWPDPRKHMKAEACRAAASAAPADRAKMVLMWSCHFQDACAAFGMEDALVAMLESPAMFRAVIDRITEFYLQANKIFLDAAGDLVDAVLIGNDFGCQTGLMVNPDQIREHALPGTRKLIAQVKSYGVKVVHHSCGSVRPIIGDIVAAGADAIHPIQALAAGMAAEELAKEFGGKASFCGGVDVQELMVHGSPADVYKRVKRLIELFPTGLVISPSHEAVLPDVPPANVDAMRRAVLGMQCG